jgi:glycosyltransferase involved in cell wall biosynthesis
MTKPIKKKPKKKILFILTYFYAGGTERVIFNLSEKLIKKNCDITIISLQTFHKSYEIPKYIKTETLSTEKSIFYRLPKFFIFHAFIKIINVIKLLRHFNKMKTKLDKFDLILNQETVVLPTFALKKSTKNKIFLWVHNDRHIKLKTKLKRWMYKKRLDGTKIITVSQGVKNFLKQCNVKAKIIKTIYNPFDIKLITELSKKPNTQIPSESYIIHAGIFCPQKRHDRLLKAFKKLKTECKLVLLTHHNDELEKLIKENGLENKVIIAGFQKNPYPWFKCAKLSVLCSDYEAMPMVIVESLACSCPVVSTDCRSGPNEILVNDLTKWLVPMNKDEDKLTDNLAAKIDEALNTKIKIDPNVFERFDADKIADEYLSLIKS